MFRRIPIVPTVLTARLLAALALVALVVGALLPSLWFAVPLAALVLLVLSLADAVLAGQLADARLLAPPLVEVGEDAELTMLADFAPGAQIGTAEAALSFDPRLGGGGRAEAPLSSTPDGSWMATANLRPERRGEAPIETLWLRWTGPLGLGARQAQRALDTSVAIRPALGPIRSPQLQAFFRDAQFGMVARRIRGAGTQFEAMTEYEPGMDRRRIDWKRSARHMHLQAREYESERDNQIVFAFDCGQAMCEPIEGVARLDRAVTAALTSSYIALKGGDRVALFGFAARPQVATPFYNDARAFHRLQKSAAGLDYRSEEPNFTLALATLAARLKRRSLVVLFSDFTDLTSAQMMVESIGRLSKHHLVLFVTMQDEELEELVAEEPKDMDTLAMAVTADTLARERALVLERLRHMGVDVIEAPWEAISYRLIDRYLDIKRGGTIG